MNDSDHVVAMETVRLRFDEKVMPEPNSGCWLWIGGVTPGGYGQFKINGKAERAHRVSYWLNKGPIPEDRHVLHKCDNTFCVNPSHLELGTRNTNMADMYARGRHPRVHFIGVQNPQAKLTETNVRRLKSGDLKSFPPKRAAALFGVSRGAIDNVRSGKNWGHVQ